MMFNPNNGPPTPGYALSASNGYPIFTNTGGFIYAPSSYQPDAFAAALSQRSIFAFTEFQQNGPLDLQRSYNNVVSGGYNGFVGDFTPVASYALGYSAAVNGIPESIPQTVAGSLNYYHSFTYPTLVHRAYSLLSPRLRRARGDGDAGGLEQHHEPIHRLPPRRAARA